jgi:hypothetical protein
MYTARIHWVDRGTGTPKDIDAVNIWEVCECDGWVCDFEVIGTPSRLRFTCKTADLTRVLHTLGWSCEENVERWKWNSPPVHCVNWTPESVKKRSVSRWSCKNKRHTNSLCKPDVIGITVIKEITLGEIVVIIVSVICPYFVSGNLIWWPISVVYR